METHRTTKRRPEYEYMTLVAENPQWDTEPYDVAFSADYGSFQSIADVLRQIGHDERVHKDGSLEAIKHRASDSTPHPSPNRGAPITAALLRSAVSSVRYSATDSRAGTNACRDSDRGGGDRDGSGAGPDPGLRQRGGALREGARVTDATGVP